MKALRVHIAGGPGSGKSVAARRIAARYGIPLTDLDSLFWQPTLNRYGVRTPPAHRDRALTEVLAQPAWVIEGVYHSWVRRALAEADLVLLMVTPMWVRHWRIIRRFARRRLGLERSKHESLSDLVSLLRWNRSYDDTVLAAIRRTLSEMGRTPIPCRQASDALRAVERHLAS
jgi:adenylate kinase family enzyme